MGISPLVLSATLSLQHFLELKWHFFTISFQHVCNHNDSEIHVDTTCFLSLARSEPLTLLDVSAAPLGV